MPKTDTKNEIFSQKRWMGIADYTKETANGQIADAYYFGRAVNYRDDPQSITLLPASVKKSGSVITDLLKWADRVPVTLTTFLYGDVGNFYQRSSAGAYSYLHTVANSHGNGLAYFTADDYVYYTGDSAIGRYGPTQGTPQFSDNFLKAQGGIPTNTNSASFVAASSQYASAADSASLSVTGNLTLESYFYANSLPAVGSSMSLVAKWDESASARSYKLDLFGVSGYFGAGTDGSLTISSNTTEAPIDSACTGTAGLQTLSATNASFAIGQIIFIHQTQGTNAGQWERNTIQGYTAGTITLGTPLIGTYVSGAQVRVLKQYTNVTINSGITYTAKAWNGTVGGILAFIANGTVAVNGAIVATLCGFRGGTGTAGNGVQFSTQYAQYGEGTGGVAATGSSAAANGNGGGASYRVGDNKAGGGAGGNAAMGGTGQTQGASAFGGIGGSAAGAADLTTMVFGGGGGGGLGDWPSGTNVGGTGGIGGGIVFVTGTTITMGGSGAIQSNGYVGSPGVNGNSGGGGASAGGSVLLKAQTATLGTGIIVANGTTGGAGGGSSENGGDSSDGRVVLDYLTSYTGTTSPTLNAIQDSTLVTTTTIQARLGISDNGTSVEYLTQNLTSLATGVWNRLSVAWTAASSMATFYLNAVALGTSTGTKTSISNNASLLYVGADKGASTVGDFFNGLQDDIRIWNNVQTAGQILTNLQLQLTGSEGGLQAYYKFNGDYTDGTSNTNTLTNHGTTFSTNVPFPAATTRLDIDQQNTNTGNTYTLLTAISEASVDRLTFTPETDPQSSVAFYVSAKGTGDWTVTVHDEQNNVVATSTITNANVPSSGAIEFIFSPQWRIFLGSSYHYHLTVSTGTSTVVTGTSNDFSTAEFTSYFGFLVTDTQFHPVIQFQYQPLGGVLTGAIIIGNERYIAVWDGKNYFPNYITFPPAWRIRCFGFWREYLAIGMWRGGNIGDFDRGRIYFWDGIAPTFNFFIDIPEGQIDALFGVDTDLYIIAGYRGYLLDYQGTFIQDTGNGQGIKVKRVPLIEPQDSIEVFPGAFTMWRSLLHIGYGVNMSSTTIQQGVYAHGTYNKYYPDTMSYDYVISTGNTGNTVSIGLVYPVGESLVIGWQDGTAFGADEVNFSNNPYAASGELRTFIMDDGALWKDKANFAVRADFTPLTSGSSVATEISINRGALTVGLTQATVGTTFVKQPVSNGRGNEYQVGTFLYSDGTSTPTLTALSLLREDLAEEQQF